MDMPPELSAALTAATLAVTALVAAVAIKLRAKNGKSLPPATSAPSPATASGSYLSIPAMIGEQMKIQVQPIVSRLDRIEDRMEGNQDTHNEWFKEVGERLAAVETRLDGLSE